MDLFIHCQSGYVAGLQTHLNGTLQSINFCVQQIYGAAVLHMSQGWHKLTNIPEGLVYHFRSEC